MSTQPSSGPAAPRGADFLRVPRRTLLAYGVSGQPLNMLGTFMAVHLAIFYTDVAGLHPSWVAVGFVVATIWDAVSDPVMGVISDRTRWKWGRRRPFILLGTLPLAAAFWFLLTPPAGLAGARLGLYFMGMMVLLYTARTVVEVPLTGLGPELAQDYHERTRLGAYREFNGNIGDLIGLIVPLLVMAAFAGDGDAAAARTAFRLTGLLGCAMCVVFLGITYRGTYEDVTFQRDIHIDWRAGMRAIANNEAFRILLISVMLIGVGLHIVNGLFLYVLKYIAGVDNDLVKATAFVAYIVAALCSYPFWVWFAHRYGKAKAFRIGLFCSSLTFVSVYILDANRLWALYAIMAFAGVANVAVWMLNFTLSADIIDLDELETGLRREGLYSGFSTLLRKAATALGGGVIGFGLTLIHYQPNVQQTPETITGLRLLFSVPTTLLVFAAYLVFRRFPLTQERHHELMLQVHERRIALGVAHADEAALPALEE